MAYVTYFMHYYAQPKVTVTLKIKRLSASLPFTDLEQLILAFSFQTPLAHHVLSPF